MAKLPYTFTICPDEPAPKQYTAMSAALINALRFTNDLTIDQKQYIWPASKGGSTRINNHEDKEKNDG
jgi:hypothetical protein